MASGCLLKGQETKGTPDRHAHIKHGSLFDRYSEKNKTERKNTKGKDQTTLSSFTAPHLVR